MKVSKNKKHKLTKRELKKRQKLRRDIELDQAGNIDGFVFCTLWRLKLSADAKLKAAYDAVIDDVEKRGVPTGPRMFLGDA